MTDLGSFPDRGLWWLSDLQASPYHLPCCPHLHPHLAHSDNVYSTEPFQPWVVPHLLGLPNLHSLATPSLPTAPSLKSPSKQLMSSNQAIVK